jgi:hypothetical protein
MMCVKLWKIAVPMSVWLIPALDLVLSFFFGRHVDGTWEIFSRPLLVLLHASVYLAS